MARYRIVPYGTMLRLWKVQRSTFWSGWVTVDCGIDTAEEAATSAKAYANEGFSGTPQIREEGV